MNKTIVWSVPAVSTDCERIMIGFSVFDFLWTVLNNCLDFLHLQNFYKCNLTNETKLHKLDDSISYRHVDVMLVREHCERDKFWLLRCSEKLFFNFSFNHFRHWQKWVWWSWNVLSIGGICMNFSRLFKCCLKYWL